MPARTPEEVAQLWAESFAAGDLDALVELYEADAMLVPQPGEVVTGIVGNTRSVGRLACHGAYVEEGLIHRGHRALFWRLDSFRDRTRRRGHRDGCTDLGRAATTGRWNLAFRNRQPFQVVPHSF
jgi:hypothetical protein